jgi:fluoroquinolone transport system ATP-binding protein
VPSADSAIDARSFSFSSPGAARAAVRGITFAVHRHEIFGFLGPSGAGKSTTQNVLIRLLDGYEGQIAVLGKDLRAWDRSYYRRVGVSFEAPNHYLRLTPLENLRLFAGLHGGLTQPPEDLLRRVGLYEDRDKLVAEFSKGMRGRLTLARALLHRPELLFLDEPTAGLDPVTARLVRQLIRELRNGGATIFLTTHDMTTADELCDRVAFSSTGRSPHWTVHVHFAWRTAEGWFGSKACMTACAPPGSSRSMAWPRTRHSCRCCERARSKRCIRSRRHWRMCSFR